MDNKDKKDKKYKILRKQANWQNLWFYRKAETLFQLTMVFTQRFLPAYGDRTVDQMVQAARSGKQNIVEGSADGVTSSEMEIKLLNVARASIQELQEDYADYLSSRHLQQWDSSHDRYKGMIDFCKSHNDIEEYEPFFNIWNDEEMANVAYTLCRMTDKMMTTYINNLETLFVTEGGIKERMTAARLGYRTDKQQELNSANQEIATLKAEIARLNETITQLKEENSRLSR